jgi:hypothetical protein
MTIAPLKKILCLVLIVGHTLCAAQPTNFNNRLHNASAYVGLGNQTNTSTHNRVQDNGLSSPLIGLIVLSAFIGTCSIYFFCRLCFCPRNPMRIHPIDNVDVDIELAPAAADDDTPPPSPNDSGYGICSHNAGGRTDYHQQIFDIGNRQSLTRYFVQLPRKIQFGLWRRSPNPEGHIEPWPLPENHPQLTILRNFEQSPLLQAREIMLIDHGENQQEDTHFTDTRSYFIRTNDGRLHAMWAGHGNWVDLPSRRLQLNYINFIVAHHVRLRYLTPRPRPLPYLRNRVLESILTIRAALPLDPQALTDIIFLYTFSGNDFLDMTDDNLKTTIEKLNSLRYPTNQGINSNVFRIVRAVP